MYNKSTKVFDMDRTCAPPKNKNDKNTNNHLFFMKSFNVFLKIISSIKGAIKQV